ncbi:MAG: uL15 family ribosomal protein [Nanoarchaeota archaeon]
MNKKRKKNTRLRGSKTHGWGMKKKHSGSGNRGGKGNAGTGKRADHKKSLILKLYGNQYFGKHGFKRNSSLITKQRVINVTELNKFDNEINLTELGITKLLGGGRLEKKLTITVDHASARAIEKIKNAGGKIITHEQVSRDTK